MAIDMQPPNGPMPFQYSQAPAQQQSQLPYPIGSPPPQSQTPSGRRTSQPQSGPPPEGYQAYASSAQPAPRPQTAFETQSNQYIPQDLGSDAYKSSLESYPQRPLSYPPLQAAGVQQAQMLDQANEYSPSNYSNFSAEEQQQQQQNLPPPQSQPLQPQGYAPLPSQQQQQQQHQSLPYGQPPPSHQPPPPPSTTPLPQSGPYPTFSPSAPPSGPTGGYQAYQRPQSFMGSPPPGAGNPAAAYAGGGNPGSF